MILLCSSLKQLLHIQESVGPSRASTLSSQAFLSPSVFRRVVPVENAGIHTKGKAAPSQRALYCQEPPTHSELLGGDSRTDGCWLQGRTEAQKAAGSAETDSD